MAYQLVFRWPSGERVLTLERPVVVGRDPDCDVPVESVRVSRRHAEFIPTPRGVSVRDLGSRNGVLVNGSRVAEAVVGPADRVLLGDVSVMVGAPARQPAVTEPLAPPVPQTPPAFDKTTLLPRGGLLPPPIAQAATAAPNVTAPVKAARPPSRRLGLGARLFGAALSISIATFAVTAVPIVSARNDAIRSTSRARATTIVRAIGAQNGAALAAGQSLGLNVQEAAAEPGVREALLLTPDGRVLAPVNRLGERVSRLPAFGDVTDLQGVQTTQVGSEIQAVAVIESAGRRLGVAWVRLDPTYAGASAPIGLYLIAAFVTSFAVAGGMAYLTRKAIRTRLATFATDVDLAISGQLDAVTESFGVPQLAASVNFIIGRLRTRPHVVAAPSAARPSSSTTAPMAREGHLVLDNAFVVQEVDATAADLLGAAQAQLLGQHVLAAIPEQSLVTALIDTIADAATVGGSPRRVVGAAGMPGLELQADRSAPNGPVRVTIRRLD